MLDPKLLRNNLDEVMAKINRRGDSIDTGKLVELEQKRKLLQVKTQELQSQKNQSAKTVGVAKAKGESVDELLANMKQFSQALKTAEQDLAALQTELDEQYLNIPNIPDDDVPDGKSEADNQEIRKVGEPVDLPFEVKDHVDLGEGLGLMDFAAAAKITGSRFVVLKGELARMQRALTQFMLDKHVKQHGYQEVYVPFMVNQASLYGTGQLPKFSDDLFHLRGEFAYSLIPTAEVPVTNLMREQIYQGALPLKYVAQTPCFRSEAGSYGKDTRGLIRQHQFEKVEMVQFVKAEDSAVQLEELTANAESILEDLKLPYRTVVLCAGDLGINAAKTYDIEVWLPAQNCYREISSCSNYRDFQARRMQARWRNPESKKPELLHTINGSGLAVGRTLVAVMENYQNADGSINIPEVLVPYMGGLTVIK